MASSWNITIIGNADGSIAFKPDYPGAQTGQALGVKKGDNVTWNNTTDQIVTLVATDPTPLFLTDPISGGKVSDPIFTVTQSPGKTIKYKCDQPPGTHSIVVS
jgi:hypothetical protein